MVFLAVVLIACLGSSLCCSVGIFCRLLSDLVLVISFPMFGRYNIYAKWMQPKYFANFASQFWILIVGLDFLKGAFKGVIVGEILYSKQLKHW